MAHWAKPFLPKLLQLQRWKKRKTLEIYKCFGQSFSLDFYKQTLTFLWFMWSYHFALSTLFFHDFLAQNEKKGRKKEWEHYATPSCFDSIRCIFMYHCCLHIQIWHCFYIFWSQEKYESIENSSVDVENESIIHIWLNGHRFFKFSPTLFSLDFGFFYSKVFWNVIFLTFF